MASDHLSRFVDQRTLHCCFLSWGPICAWSMTEEVTATGTALGTSWSGICCWQGSTTYTMTLKQDLNRSVQNVGSGEDSWRECLNHTATQAWWATLILCGLVQGDFCKGNGHNFFKSTNKIAVSYTNKLVRQILCEVRDQILLNYCDDVRWPSLWLAWTINLTLS